MRRQFSISCSNGISRRPVSTLAAISEPGVTACSMTSAAPVARIATCMMKRAEREALLSALLWAALRSSTRQHAALGGAPALRERRQHAHRRDHLGMAHRRADVAAELAARLPRLGLGVAGREVGEHAEQHEDQRRADREQAVERVQQEQHDEEQGRPQHLERRARGGRGQEAVDLAEVAHRLAGLAALAGERLARRRLQHRQAEAARGRHREHVEHPGADVLEHAEHHERADRDDHQHRQRLEAAAAQHAVVELQHEQRHREVQQRDEEADQQREQHAADELPADQAQGFVGCAHAVCPRPGETRPPGAGAIAAILRTRRPAPARARAPTSGTVGKIPEDLVTRPPKGPDRS